MFNGQVAESIRLILITRDASANRTRVDREVAAVRRFDPYEGTRGEKSNMSNGRGLCCAVLLGALSALPATTHANINLELRTLSSTAGVGDTIEVGLYAVSDDNTNQAFIGLQVIIGWDANALMLTSVLENGFDWLGFSLDDCGVDQLSNEICPPLDGCISSGGVPCNDGDILLNAFNFAVDALATPEGVLVATYVFQATCPGSSARVWVIPVGGPRSETFVLVNDPAIPLVTGTLGELILSIVSCGTCGDFNGNCRVELFPDHFDFVGCMNGPDGAPLPPVCNPADFNGDGVADMLDAAAFQREFTGP